MIEPAPAPTAIDGRDGERIRARIPVHYGVEATEHAGFAENISPGGLYINTNHVFRVGERLTVRIDFPQKSIVRQAEVVWAIRVPEHLASSMVCGMGVSFVDSDPLWAAFFRRWRASLVAARSEPARG